MKVKSKQLVVLLLVFVFIIAGCGNQSSNSDANGQAAQNGQKEQTDSQAGTESESSALKTVTYLGKDYQVPEKAGKIAVLAVEAMEEMHVLGVKPYAAAKDMYVNGIPEEMGDSLDGVKWIDSGVQPDKEQLLALKPDVILTTARLDAETLKPLEQIAPTIPLSFSGADSEANITVVAEITGKAEEAKNVIEGYKEQLQKSKELIAGSSNKDKTVMYLRISTQYGLSGYSAQTTYNAVLYDGLGLSVPELIGAIERRETIPLEKMAQANPDYIFALVPLNDLQAIEDLKTKPLWNQIQAVQDGHVYVNPVHPDLFGTPILSKTKFLEQVTATLGNAK
ncbi:ABC transporter substrate-binding protein [Paenibacillus mendelii]|uniref:ABC transporter substrate-binding protein n=1 Tax=Paenibacillus mendelii TaxID=206163 RepID=A0ABV6J858_9BACL|nr:ABC transporter substrate-binding protein [Paenibacillus mendelii]MCQ6561269.1 ABC transporter substrate-binding protein [Paenibacillus mendelii]